MSLASPFRELFENEFSYVCRSLRRLGVRESDLSDVAQDLFMRVHEQFDRIDLERPIRPWLFAIALRYAANYRRLARNQNHFPEDDVAMVASESNVFARDLVLRALATLPFDKRVVVVMHDLEGFDAPEIASQTGVPLNTVYSRLRLARADFRTAVDTLQKGGAS